MAIRTRSFAPKICPDAEVPPEMNGCANTEVTARADFFKKDRLFMFDIIKLSVTGSHNLWAEYSIVAIASKESTTLAVSTGQSVDKFGFLVTPAKAGV